MTNSATPGRGGSLPSFYVHCATAAFLNKRFKLLDLKTTWQIKQFEQFLFIAKFWGYRHKADFTEKSPETVNRGAHSQVDLR